jgi:hypothetical protein
MKILTVCPSCGDPLSNIILPYQKDMKALCDKYEIDHERLSSQPLGDNDFNNEKKEIINKYVSKERLCCRMHVSNSSDIVKLVH